MKTILLPLMVKKAKNPHGSSKQTRHGRPSAHDLEHERLGREGREAYERGDYEGAARAWRHLHEHCPNAPRIKHNLALALMRLGELEEARRLLVEALTLDPSLTRAHNNLAIVLMRMGASLESLIPIFRAALATTTDKYEFIRHTLNLFMSVAYGLDSGAVEALNRLEPEVFAVIDNFAPDSREPNKRRYAAIIDAYRCIAKYRQFLAGRKWGLAESSLNEAKIKFNALHELGLNRLADSIDISVAPCFNLCKLTFTYLERIASDQDFGVASALTEGDQLLQSARELRKIDTLIQVQLVDVVGWFLAEVVHKLRFLLSPGREEYKSAHLPTSIIRGLTAESYQNIGSDFVSFLNFLDRQCEDFAETAGRIATNSLVEKVRHEAWAKIALHCHGLAFDFRGVDVYMARSLLGWTDDPVADTKKRVDEFRGHVERQACKDILVNDAPQENIARALLQAFLVSRSYREVPVRGGYADIIVFDRRGGRVLIETKIWRGEEYHEQGLRELEEYIIGESTDNQLIAAFYVVFDPTKGFQSAEYQGAATATRIIAGVAVEVVMIRLRPPVPSKKPAR